MRIAHNKTSSDIETSVVNLYNQGIGSTTICKKCNIHYGTVLNILRRNGVVVRKMRDAKRIYQYNDSFFEKIDTEEKAYWLGFILTDGCVSVRNEWKKDLIITIKDLGHLKKFVDNINGNNKIQTIKRKVNKKIKIYETLNVRSQKMVMDLMNLGITPRKSMTVKIPVLSDYLYPHFWRGVIDGDGTMGFYINKKRYNQCPFSIGLVGNEFVVSSFVEYVKKVLGIELNYYPHKSIFGVKTTSSKAIKISNHLYKNAKIFLDRKMKLAIKSFDA